MATRSYCVLEKLAFGSQDGALLIRPLVRKPFILLTLIFLLTNSLRSFFKSLM